MIKLETTRNTYLQIQDIQVWSAKVSGGGGSTTTTTTSSSSGGTIKTGGKGAWGMGGGSTTTYTFSGKDKKITLSGPTQSTTYSN